ncbi:Uncharacterised protein [uncultured archaeon]|nr:Uncharacterised protein [uncultured archaeon]
MNKKGRTKLFVIVGICLSILLISGLIAATDATNTEQIQQKTDSQVSGDVQGYVEKFVEKKGINTEQINNITQVDFNSLPKEVNIENVKDSNLAIYQINYNKSSEKQDKVFVITYSVEKLKSQGDLIVAQDKREFLNFGFNEKTDKSVFLRTANGVDGSLEKGYVMMRDGSITGISTNLETLSGEGNIEIIIYKNGEQIQFGNSFVVSSVGIKKDYDVQSRGTVEFKAGDVISAYAKVSDGISWKDANTLVEITTSD